MTFAIPTDMQLTEDRLEAILGLYRNLLLERVSLTQQLATIPKQYKSYSDRNNILLDTHAKIAEIEKKISFSYRMDYLRTNPLTLEDVKR